MSSSVPRNLQRLITPVALFFQTPSLRTMGNIVTGTDQQTQVAIDAGMLNVLPQLLMHPKSFIQKEAAWALSNVAAGPCQHIQRLIGCGMLPPLVALLKNVSGALCVHNKRLFSNQSHVELLQEFRDRLRSKSIEIPTE